MQTAIPDINECGGPAPPPGGGGGGRGWGTPYNGLYGEAPPERGNLFQASGILKGREFTSYSI